MADPAAIDNDVLYKAIWFGLLRELLAVTPCALADAVILGQAKFVLRRRFRKQQRNGTPNADVAMKNFIDAWSELTPVEPTEAESAFAAELETDATRAGVQLDGGETLLCSMVVHRCIPRLVTGDKRAIAALEGLLPGKAILGTMRGKVLCLEQLFLRLLSQSESSGNLRSAVCANRHVDQALAMCFACASDEVGADGWRLGLVSYIESVRRTAPSMLVIDDS